MTDRDPHLWLALSPHGYGHAAMSAPVVAELRRRWPGLRVTIQTSLPRAFLETRFGVFDHVPEIPDFGLKMHSSTDIDIEASAAAYLELHADLPAVIAAEAGRLAVARPDLVLSNVAYVPIAAAAEAGVPMAALSCLNWADLYAHYLSGRPESRRIEAEIRACYGRAAMFLRCTPAQTMTLPNLRDVGVVASGGRRRREKLAENIGLDDSARIGLIAFGGIDHRLALDRWPVLPGWVWLSTLPDTPARADLVPWERSGLPFMDLIPSVDVLVTKPGYGTFTEAGMAGTPVLFVPRPGWPESPHLDDWLARHTRCLAVEPEGLLGDQLALHLQALFSLPEQPVADATGVAEVADLLESLIKPG